MVLPLYYPLLLPGRAATLRSRLADTRSLGVRYP